MALQLGLQKFGVGERSASCGNGGTDDEAGTPNGAAQPVSSSTSGASIGSDASRVNTGTGSDAREFIDVFLVLRNSGFAAFLPAFLAGLVKFPLVGKEKRCRRPESRQ